MATATIFWLFHKVDASRVWSAVLHANPPLVAAGVLLCLATVVIAGWRWQKLLCIFGIKVPLKPLVCIAQIGQFFMLFLPGPLGDDLTRMLYISRVAKGRTGEACLSVILDRVIGLAAVLALAAACMPWHWQILGTSAQTHVIALVIALAGLAVCAGAAAYFLAFSPDSRLVPGILSLIPLPRVRTESLRIWHLTVRNKRGIAMVTAAALLTQILVCGMFALAGLAVGIDIRVSIWMGFVPIVMASNAVPVTVAGIGVREYLLVLFLGVLAGIGSEQALAASLIAFLMMVITGLIGGLVYVVYRPERVVVPE